MAGENRVAAPARTCDCKQSRAHAKRELEAARAEKVRTIRGILRRSWANFDPAWPASDVGKRSLQQAMTELERWYCNICLRTPASSFGRLLYGGYNSGKTTLLTTMGEAIDAYRPYGKLAGERTFILSERRLARVVFLAKELNELSDSSLSTAFLVIDDLGAYKPPALREPIMQFYRDVIESRVKAGRPTAISTNLSYGELSDWTPPDLFSMINRMLGNSPALISANYIILDDVGDYTCRGNKS